ncbi:hypothetical protein [Sphingomonas psychrotolerans]|uniref:Uncharacterized protein n=1 Tax=Sphingomonas psychrotolerans TaxID=1327635 RepID=A0A2K8MCR4_9SPHN|nr:hypothetical protein [Sphingomonas psychrotolerans]ATY31682.1 hypothetical protein CVN68_06625 [Sphingomonas psychrotolerans]
MQRDYHTLINLAVELGQYGGYLDTQGLKERNDLTTKYNSATRTFVYRLLKEGHSPEESARLVSEEINNIAALSDAGWQPVYEEIRGDILAQLDRDAGKRPWQRTARHFTPFIAAAIVTVGYFGLRLYNVTPVSAPLETRAGIAQRADALAKVMRYDDWSSSRRGGFVKGILLWPIEPSQTEVKGAQELGGLIFAGANDLMRSREACNTGLTNGSGQLTRAEIELLNKVVTHLREKSTKWQNPPAMTILDPLRTAYPC